MLIPMVWAVAGLTVGFGLWLRLLGIETEKLARELYTFECGKCGRLEVRGVITARRRWTKPLLF
jgi:hypothetical protein